MNTILLILLGLFAGVLSGVFGIGGGIILIPGLVYLFAFKQQLAQGTTLAAMIPPIGLLAALKYWQSGNVKLSAAALICVGFFIGGFIGASFVQNIPSQLLKKLFGVFLLAVSLHMIGTK